MKLLLAVAALALVGACTAGGDSAPLIEQVRLGCHAFAVNLNIATDLFNADLLNDDAVVAIDNVVQVVGPVCSASEPPTDAINIVTSGSAAIADAISAAVGG